MRKETLEPFSWTMVSFPVQAAHRVCFWARTLTMYQGYYNKAIAASPVHALPGYIIGGLAWFAIPWLCATTMGLSALALEGTPAFPTYPDRMLPADITAGLVLPYAAIGLLGRSGAICTLIMIFSKMRLLAPSEMLLRRLTLVNQWP